MAALRCWCRHSVLLPVHEIQAGEEISCKHQARTCLYLIPCCFPHPCDASHQHCERAFLLHHEVYQVILEKYNEAELAQSHHGSEHYKEELDNLDMVAVAREFASIVINFLASSCEQVVYYYYY